MIDRTIKSIKKYFYTLEEILTTKISEKRNNLQGFRGNTYSKNSKYKKKFFLSFLYIKGLDIKHGSNIS